MKEKIKKIIKNKYFKAIVFILLGLFIIREGYGIYIDMYNFKQLEKAKPYLETINKNTERFYNLKDFNQMFNTNIKPIKNCYDVINYNGEFLYIFGFKLESLTYKIIYGDELYAYPGYDLPYVPIGTQGWKGDMNKIHFEEVISNPCEE